MKWGAVEDDNICSWVVHWKNAGRVVRSIELEDMVEDILKVREEIDQEVDAVGRNGSLVEVDFHVNQCVASIRWEGKQLVIIQGFADHKVDC